MAHLLSSCQKGAVPLQVHFEEPEVVLAQETTQPRVHLDIVEVVYGVYVARALVYFAAELAETGVLDVRLEVGSCDQHQQKTQMARWKRHRVKLPSFRSLRGRAVANAFSTATDSAVSNR
jgi:hypothetical protein